jgi:hypothetical protein
MNIQFLNTLNNNYNNYNTETEKVNINTKITDTIKNTIQTSDTNITDIWKARGIDDKSGKPISYIQLRSMFG